MSDSTISINADSSRRTILIVGAGYAGLRFFAESLQLTISQQLCDSVRYVFVDKRPRETYGRGVAWASDQNPQMRTNMHIPEITADPATGKTVAEIVGLSYDHKPTASELFVRREEVGAIFADQFNKCEKIAIENGVETFSLQDEVTDVNRIGINYKITLASERQIVADFIVLALGHISPTSYPDLFESKGYIRNPWAREDEIKEIAKDARVAIVGLGPTAVDTIIKLRDNGIPAVRAYSRTGAMQFPRPIPGKFSARLLTEENLLAVHQTIGPLRLEFLRGMVASEFLMQEVDWKPLLEAVAVSKNPPLDALRYGYANCNKVADWFGLAATLTDVIPIAWHILDERDREDFRKLHSELSNVLYGMAPSHALRILKELEDRTLIIQGGLESVRHSNAEGQFTIKCKDGDIKIEDKLDYVIECTGFGRDLKLSSTRLISSLLGKQYIRPHRFGGAAVDFYSGQVERSGGGRALRIYCLTGSLNIGCRFVTNGLGEVASSAHRTARAIHSLLDDVEPNQTPLSVLGTLH
jgi:uncharacterized NAD(P)/FAD-binding protein YdhS